ncbi:Gfo/Idh/MocA family protein [Zhouia amylolytica]|uniref:Gfo/Idh/MocA family protein n=1 Tax=Zhouia amylolytica TaxID=376730 RepID=UPI0020CFD6F0|nr:Gfo/Idh/MocA family oxidoreductase [Zhouia amylolytica]MCQ0111510.1 Gfo/Idh/MocA family oxidoreductase [Zhouia amylolytica]
MDLPIALKLPQPSLPIVIIGAGGIVKDAHLPAYAKAGFKIQGIYDIDIRKAQVLREKFPEIQKVYASFEEMISETKNKQVVYDLAVPANLHSEILEKLPNGANVLLQKPMGENLEEANAILDICNRKKLTGAVNFQLRYAPYCLVAKKMIEEGMIGEVYDMEVKVCVYTPWHLWDFLFSLPRVEVLYHSIHYLDLTRSFLGTPNKVYASTLKHPKMKDLASTRSTIILDYDDYTQARIITNHGHDFGLKHQESYLKIEGTEGAIKIRIGLSLDYPKGMPPKFEYNLSNDGKGWQELPLDGAWFPDAFMGPMAALQMHVIDNKRDIGVSLEDAYETMRLVETVYESNENGGVSF